MENKELNLWPHAIITMIILGIIAGGWTIKIALDNPVELDNYYFEKYQDVKRDMNEIMEKQDEFDANFAINYGIESIKLNQEFFVPIKIQNKTNNSYVKDANIAFMLTRPDTNKLNVELSATKAKDDIFTFGPLKVDKIGRWQILTKIEINGKVGFFTKEVNATQ